VTTGSCTPLRRWRDLHLSHGATLKVDELADALRTPMARVKDVAAGLAVEDDFILRLRSREWFECAVKIDQARYLEADSIQSPDVLVIAPEDRPSWFSRASLVEVKDTAEPTWRISKADFKRRARFAEACGLPLFFAVRLAGHLWTLTPADDIGRTRKVRIEDALTTSWWDEYVGDFSVLLFPNVVLEEEWDSDPAQAHLTPRGSLGSLRRFTIRLGNRTLEGEWAQGHLTHLFFSSLLVERSLKVVEGTRTTVTKHLKGQQLARFTNLWLEANRCVQGTPDSSSAALRAMTRGEWKPAVKRSLLSAVAIGAEEQGFLFPFWTRRGTGDMYRLHTQPAAAADLE